MYLKELTLKGFKSFAQPTVLQFEPGITAIVGPNGSGKSNVVDALAWVMGEQGVRSLRGSAMDDVIFAGTSTKPALGRAEVSLTIDNSDHTLDIEYTEVTITRTLFRNSGSQYAINGAPCRLLDVQELLNDAGLGSHMHVIVGQGRLDAILHADPQGHRALIEEAAGILKHRRRKERALRKLDAAADNVQRLDDVLREIHTRMGPLSRQATMSRRADLISARVHDAQARLHAADAAALQDQRQAVMQELAQVRVKHEELNTQLTSVLERIHHAEHIARTTSPHLEQLHTYRRDLDRLLERYRTLHTVAAERARNHTARIVTTSGESIEPLLARAAELETMAQSQQQRITQSRLTLDQAITERTRQEHELAQVRQALDELQSALQAHDHKLHQLQQQYAAASAENTQREQRLDETRAQVQAAEAKVSTVAERVHALAQASQEFDVEAVTERIQHAQDTLSSLRVQLANAKEQEQVISQRIIAAQAKVDAIADTLHARDEAQEQELPLALRQSHHILGKISEFLRIRDGYEEAVALALEPMGQAFVVQSFDDIATALQSTSAKVSLIASNANRQTPQEEIEQATGMQYATLPILDHVEPASQLISARASEAHDIHEATGVCQTVQALLRTTCVYTADQPITEAQLQDLWNLGWTSVLTRTQCWRSPSVVVQGAASAYSDMSLMARKDKAHADIATIQKQYDLAKQETGRVQEQVDQAQQHVEQLRHKRQELQVQAAREQATAEAAERALDQAQAELQSVVQRYEALQETVERGKRRVEALKVALDSVSLDDTQSHDPRALQTQERQIEQLLTDARAQEQQARVELAGAQEKAASYTRQARMLKENAQTMQHKQEQTEQRNKQHEQAAQQLEALARRAKSCATQVQEDSLKLEQALFTLQETSSHQQGQLQSLRAQQETLSSQLAQVQQRQTSLDISRERLAVQYGQVEHAIRTDTGLSVEEAIAQFGPDQLAPVYNKDGSIRVDEHDQVQLRPFNRQEQTQELERAKAQLSRLGKINPLAVEEYDALQDRLKHLNQQRDDVIASRNDLLQLIEHLDHTMQRTFLEAFEATAHAFETMFGVLFPGGSGKLVLDDYEHPLEAGVHVEARPAGKRVKQLSLLSGGERSLTTLALLFAIFTARPSPFYILDEVEAALDDMNLTRLLNAFEKLRESSQLLVITHQQRTMAMADALVGVTMRADGVSATISQKVRK